MASLLRLFLFRNFNSKPKLKNRKLKIHRKSFFTSNSSVTFRLRSKARCAHGFLLPNKSVFDQFERRVICGRCSGVVRCSKVCRISWRLSSVTYDDAPATREVASPVSWVRDANRLCELITQAARVSQGSFPPPGSTRPLLPWVRVHSRSLVNRQSAGGH